MEISVTERFRRNRKGEIEFARLVVPVITRSCNMYTLYKDCGALTILRAMQTRTSFEQFSPSEK